MDVGIYEARQCISIPAVNNHCVGSNTVVVDGGNRYALPGFIDAHVHVESSMLNLREFGRLAAMHGVTSIVADPHEVGNVLGIEGAVFFLMFLGNVYKRCFYSCLLELIHV